MPHPVPKTVTASSSVDASLDATSVIKAAVSSLVTTAQGRKTLGIEKLPEDETASQMARWHDRNGPGFVRAYLNTRGDFIGLAPLQPQKYENGKWVWCENDQTAMSAAESIRGPQGETLADMQRTMGRELAAVGQVAVAPRNGPTGVTWHVLAADQGSYFSIQPPGKSEPDKGWLAWPANENLKTPPSPKEAQELVNDPNPSEWLVFPVVDENGNRIVRTIYRSHPQFWGSPVEPLSHVVRDIRRFENASRALHRATASQLVNAGLMWFHGSRKDAQELAQGLIAGSPDATSYIAQQVMVFLAAAERSLNDYFDHDQLSVVPYPILSEEPPQPVDVGRLIDPNLIPTKRDALEDVARGLDIPQSWITEGPGAGHRLLNQWRQEASAKEGVVPEARMIGTGLTEIIYHPMLAAIEKVRPGALGGLSPKAFRLWPNETGLKPQEPADMDSVFEAWDRGLLTDEGVVGALQMEGAMRPLPEGVTSFDRWKLSTGGGGVSRRRDAAATSSTLDEWFNPL